MDLRKKRRKLAIIMSAGRGGGRPRISFSGTIEEGATTGRAVGTASLTNPPEDIGTLTWSELGTRPTIPPNPVTVEMQQAKTKKYNDFHTCIGARFHEPAVLADTSAFEEANTGSGWAAANRDLAGFNAQVAIMDAELARLKPIYGC